MDVSVPAVTAGFHSDPVAQTDFFCQTYIFGDPGSWHYNIAFLLGYRLCLHSLQDPATDAPDRIRPLRCVCYSHINSTMGKSSFTCRLNCPVQFTLAGGVVHNDQCRVPLCNRKGLFQVFLHHFDQFPLKKFNSCRHKGQFQDHRDHVRAFFQRRERNHQGAGFLRHWKKFQGNLSQDTEGSLTSDDQVLKIVACSVFHNIGGKFHNTAVRKHCLDTPDKVSGKAVADCFHSSCVGDHIASDRSCLFPGIRRIKKPFCSGSSLDIGKQGSRFYSNRLVLMIYRKNTVHPHNRKHDPAEFTAGASCQTGTGSPADNRDILFIGIGHDRRYFFFIHHFYIKLRGISTIVWHLIMIIFFGDLLPYPDPAAVCKPADGLRIILIHFFIRIWHSLYSSLRFFRHSINTGTTWYKSSTIQ